MLIWYIYRIMCLKWIIERFTRLFFGYDCFMWCFCKMVSFICMIFIMFIYVDFIWNKCGIMWLYDMEFIWDLLRYDILFLYDWLVIDLRWYYFYMIAVLFFVIIVWFFVNCFLFIVTFLVDILINIIVCNALYYKGL